jgi:sirohydrochlorin ferrochelatase
VAAVILWPEFELVKVDFMDRPIVLVVGHGSRETAANDEFEQLVARYQTRRPQFELRFGYLELAQPSLADALANVGGSEASVTLLPLFLFAAGHMKNDIPQALAVARRERPGVPFCVARALGVHRGMVDLALERADDGGHGRQGSERRGRQSRFPRSGANVRRIASVSLGAALLRRHRPASV